MTGTIYIAEVTAFDPSIPGTRVLRYSTGQGHTTRPAETPANAYYDPRIAQPALVRRDLFDAGTTAGQSRIGYGDLVLLNEDGALDELLNYAFDGREIVIRQGPVGAAYPGGFDTILVGTMEQPEVARSTVTIKVRDRQAELETPLQATKYAGDNVLPDGLEGVADDLKGKPKPLLFGNVANISIPCVNSAKLIFQVNDGEVYAITVYDRGIELTNGGTYSNADELLNDSLAPAAGSFKYWPAGGYVRLGASPAGLVTADAIGSISYAATAGQIFVRLLARAGKSEADWSASDIVALDTANGATLGLWISEEIPLADILDVVAGSVGGWWGVDRNGIFRIQQFTAPSGPPTVTLTANDLLTPLERLATNDDWKGLPVYRCTVRYRRNYTVQTTDLAAGVDAARRAALSTEWREAVATDDAVKVEHLLSPDTTEDSLLVLESDAIDEAVRRQTLRGVRRDRFDLVIPLDSRTAAIDLGDVVELVHPRYGLSVGKLFRVLGIEPNAKDSVLSLTVWG
jgi:hypothetical protein